MGNPKPVLCEHCDQVIGQASSLEEVAALAEKHLPSCRRDRIPSCPDADLR